MSMETVISVMVATTVVTIAVSVWLRRHTLGSPVEAPKTLGIILTGVGMVLISPQATPWTGSALHTLTGVWQMDTALGHIAIIIGQMNIVYGLLGYVFDDTQRQDWFGRWITPAATPALTVILASVIVSHSTDTYSPNILELADDTWMRLHWLATSATLLWVWCAAARVLTLLYRADPSTRWIAGWYLTWFIVAISAAEAAAIRTIVGHPVFSHGIVAWTLLCAGLSGICATAAYSWQDRVHAMTARYSTPPRLHSGADE